MTTTSFTELFKTLTTGNAPFPWQCALYERMVSADFPAAADLPTGLGKTSVIMVWLLALLTHRDKVPRRLVYVVNRRTVVDQTTAEVERVRQELQKNPDLRAKLQAMCAVPTEEPLGLSTLRGQFADNREWCADPARPAVIVGTVDMIGSGLLFSRYTCGFKARPHHAALLGQDVLLVHDEAHLEPAFQKLLDSIEEEQKCSGETRPLKVLKLSATNRNDAAPADFTRTLRLSKADADHPVVAKRINATKLLRLAALGDEKQLADKLAELVLSRRDSGRAVLIFARSVEVVQKIEASIGKAKLPVVALTGTMRGKERDTLSGNPTFARFLPPSSRADSTQELTSGTVYLVATSAGEVGVNLSADELVCDLSTFESMAQRFGRVNRFGQLTDATIVVVHPEKFKADDAMDEARSRTLDLLRQLNGNASPHALGQLDAAARSNAFSPPPKIRPATDILFDAWAMTSIRGPLPGRPPVAPYLHGETEWEPPETYVAWRSEVEIITDALIANYPPEELLADFPLKPHELLRDRSDRVQAELEKLADAAVRNAEKIVWLVDEDGEVARKQLKELLGKDSQALLHGATVLLPPSVGGLSKRGLLDGKSEAPDDTGLDVADILSGPDEKPLRCRVRSDKTKVPSGFRGLRIVRVIDTLRGKEDLDERPESELETRYWLWLEAPKSAGVESLRSADESILLEDHTSDVEAHARAIVGKLAIPSPLANCVILAARFHDLGKRRLYWQRGIGNINADVWLAKAGPDLTPRQLEERYRHEFGSLLDAEKETEFRKLPPHEQDLVLHLIAAHHGRARPHFPTSPHDETFEPEASLDDARRIAAEVPRRFARLQRRYGRWGLAYLESLLRAADYAASAGIKPLPEAKP
ncbi:MAG TPA: type I-U CRISPR-associated helicase/endonuclease Cas3 [Verrucomicrobiae bacterium]|nr:type I-U CRISPR-associated helicase/endonuclease Cas3 [Verrucomicrobiae bacterium]